MLRRLGLQLARRRDIGHQRHVDETGRLAAHLVAQLADRLDERQALDIAHRAADLAEHEIEIVGLVAREGLDRVGHVRDHLHRRAQVIAASLLGDDVAVDAARGDVVRLPRRNAGEAFVVAKVEVRLRAIVGHEDLAVLVGAHRARIDVQIGVELADPHPKAARLQQRREARCHKPFAKRGDHAAGDENEPRHGRWALPSDAHNAQGCRPDSDRQSTSERTWTKTNRRGQPPQGGRMHRERVPDEPALVDYCLAPPASGSAAAPLAGAAEAGAAG